MIRLWVLRHGQAEPRAASDAERALTERGDADAHAVAAWLERQPQRPQRILASPYRRAQQTAAAVGEALKLNVTTAPEPIPDADPVAIADWLSQQGDSLLLVSHQPLLSALVGWLVAGRVRAGPPLETASLVCMEGDVCAPGCLTLRRVLHAAELREP